uniref:Uncharacterized protein n=1 Tax=Chromera velia CCMP2878 TaxID=1169474 RepID=A0A0G4HHD1_9ALVE|eukprot:Cvel_27455.t1-p1 / transcript=Cvel_27455.t1 / gene=Cvel_27455 / organism=Chromera_velia_CCMP2878 / gene_product=hypothetical protein / transcript_product=hypothetical protein / location=Cvel_scaffold3428:10558-10926(+) / protein_length=123 / sequence_SO=supercontig / SO=protein_coding / is_pseudo=false
MEGQLSVEQLATLAQRQAAHIEAQETRLRLQDERIGNLSNQIATVSATSSSAVSKAVKAIGDFDGNVEQSREQYADWVRVCENYAKFHKMTDAELLNAADSYLKDRASKAVREAEDNGHKPTI